MPNGATAYDDDSHKFMQWRIYFTGETWFRICEDPEHNVVVVASNDNLSKKFPSVLVIWIVK